MKFADTNIREFLYTPGMFYEIPEFQRPYSWQIYNIREFLSDLEESIASKKNHYFGTVVIVKDGENINSSAIIDGQQRVTTSLLMITAIYHLMKDNPKLSAQAAEEIKEMYLVNRIHNRVKLRTVTTDNSVLQKIFDADGDENKLTSEEKKSNLFQAYSEFREYLSKQDGLERYIVALNQFSIAKIALDSNDDNPQRVFESINSTGKPLTDGDKIRNFALMLNNNTVRQHVYKNYWTKIEQDLTDVNKDYITDFFRSYIISKRQAIVRMDAVYPEFKKLFYSQISTDQNISEIDIFYSDIVKFLEFYLLLKFGKDPDQKYTPIKDVTYKMRYIQTDLYIPFALSVISHYSQGALNSSQLSEVFKLIEVYFSRRIVCNINTTSVDRFISSLHKDILGYLKDSPDSEYVEIMKYLLLSRTGQTRIPSDTEFTRAVQTNPTYNQRNSHVMYILLSVDDLSKESETLRQVANGELKLSIEHVMPQTLTKDWEKELGIEEKGIEYIRNLHEAYLHTLANLTLTAYNSEYSNSPFETKKLTENGFNQSRLALNKWIAARNKWNEDALKDRQDWWIKNLKKVWPIPTSTFKPPVSDSTISLLDTNQDFTGKGIRSIQVFGDVTLVGTWAEALDIICEELYEKHSNFLHTVSEDEFLSRVIKIDHSGFSNSMEILETGLYIDTGNNTNTKLRIIQSLGKKFNLSKNDIKAELTKIDAQE